MGFGTWIEIRADDEGYQSNFLRAERSKEEQVAGAERASLLQPLGRPHYLSLQLYLGNL